MERRHYAFDCNWKVFVDNYLDGGYHVPHLHKGLDSVLDYSKYMIENGEHFCLQWSPLVSEGAEAQTGAVRKGDRALYYWIYPNFMINWYQGAMDTNLVIPRGVDKTEVIFDFYFPDVSAAARERNQASIEVGQRIQDEDVAICKSVQRGLSSRAYNAGRLSVRREAGEHLFHRLLLRTIAPSEPRTVRVYTSTGVGKHWPGFTFHRHSGGHRFTFRRRPFLTIKKAFGRRNRNQSFVQRTAPGGNLHVNQIRVEVKINVSFLFRVHVGSSITADLPTPRSPNFAVIHQTAFPVAGIIFERQPVCVAHASPR